MNIIHVSPYFPPDLGGVEHIVQSLAVQQAAQGHDVTVLTGNTRFRTEEEHTKIRVVRLASIRIGTTRVFPSLIRHLLQVPHDAVVHVHVAHAFAPEVVQLLRTVRGYTTVMHIHLDVPPSGPLWFLLRPYKRFILGPVLRRANAVIVANDQYRALLRDRYRRTHHVFTVPNGVDQEYFTIRRTLRTTGTRVLYVGRLAAQKRVERLLDAAIAAPELHIDIVGDGDQRARIEARARNDGIENVTFHGRLEGAPLRACYARADAFVLPSDCEAMPLVILEAMASGLPVVATDALGTRDTVGDAGVLVRPFSGTALATALQTLLANSAERKRLSRLGRARAIAWQWEAIAAQCARVYVEVRP